MSVSQSVPVHVDAELECHVPRMKRVSVNVENVVAYYCELADRTLNIVLSGLLHVMINVQSIHADLCIKTLVLYDREMSYENLHIHCKHAFPSKMLLYKTVLLAYKIFNDGYLNDDWLSFNFQQNFNNRNTNLNIHL